MTEAGAGVFVPAEEGTGHVGTVDGEMLDYTIGHTMARPLVDGTATFRASWTAPMATASYGFEVYAVTSDDGDGMDDPELAEEMNDSVGRFEFEVGVGCDLVPFYYDGDGDGYGAAERLACEQPAGYAPLGGDCKDDDPLVNPGAVELCSFADENCDGDSMAPPTFYEDVDGDGYGEITALRVDVCTVPDGYVERPGDCAPTDPSVHPGAVEVPANALDDNCDGTIDEMSVTPSGEDAAVPSTPSASTDPLVGAPMVGVPPSTSSGEPSVGVSEQMSPDGAEPAACAHSVPRRTNIGLLVGLGLASAGFVRRRRGNSR
jgi:hypothetical protein